MKLGSLCTGYGGLDLAVEALLGTETVWLSEIDANAAKVCEARFPGVANLGDLTVIDWSQVEPVDVLTAGYPCQPFSHAGKRQGTNDARHIWPFILDALRVLRPRLAVFENVAGHLSLGFDAVLGDLASIGFDAEWCVVRASDVGACHQRKRLFIAAADASSRAGVAAHGYLPVRRRSDDPEQARVGGGTPAHPSGQRHGRGQDARVVGRVDGEDAGGPRQRQRARSFAGDRGDAPLADAHSSGPQGRGEHDMAPREGEAAAQHRSPAADAQRLGLQGSNDAGSGTGLGAPRREPAGAHPAIAWGAYGPAIQRHAALVGRVAPAPTDDRGRLSARFVEWMMCLPDGWVTDILPRNPALKALGNGVVPPQAAYAVAHLLQRAEVGEVAA